MVLHRTGIGTLSVVWVLAPVHKDRTEEKLISWPLFLCELRGPRFKRPLYIITTSIFYASYFKCWLQTRLKCKIFGPDQLHILIVRHLLGSPIKQLHFPVIYGTGNNESRGVILYRGVQRENDQSWLCLVKCSILIKLPKIESFSQRNVFSSFALYIKHFNPHVFQITRQCGPAARYLVLCGEASSSWLLLRQKDSP